VVAASVRTGILIGVALFALVVSVQGASASTGVEHFCVTAFPSAASTTTGGVTLYNRQASVQMVECNNFGFGESIHLGLADVCSLLAGAIGLKFRAWDEFSNVVGASCSGAQLSAHPDAGTAAGVVCGMLSDLLGGKPWAIAFGTAAGIACTFGEPTGSWIESKREQHTAEAVWADHKCIKYSRHSFPRTDRWSAVACAASDPGFSMPPQGSTGGAATPALINLAQVARGDFSSLSGKWTVRAYGSRVHWVSGSPSENATLTVDRSKLVFGQSLPAVVTHEGLTYSASDGALPLRWKIAKNVLTASLVNEMVAINWAVYVSPGGPGAIPLIPSNSGLKLAARPTIVLWTSSNSYAVVFQR
jgi:hypothetical protein